MPFFLQDIPDDSCAKAGRAAYSSVRFFKINTLGSQTHHTLFTKKQIKSRPNYEGKVKCSRPAPEQALKKVYVVYLRAQAISSRQGRA